MPAVPLHSSGRAAVLVHRPASERPRVRFGVARASPMWAWSSRALRRAARWTAGATAGVGALAGAQAFALHALYEALPDATGPTEGIAAPNTIFPTVAERPVAHPRQGGSRGARALRPIRPTQARRRRRRGTQASKV